MTYPIAARAFYISALPVFCGSFFLLDHFGAFQYFALFFVVLSATKALADPRADITHHGLVRTAITVERI